MFLFFLSSLLKTSRRPVTCFLFPPVFQMKVPPQSSLFFHSLLSCGGERGGGGYEVICHLSPPFSLFALLEKKGGREYNLGSCPSFFQWEKGGEGRRRGLCQIPLHFSFFLPSQTQPRNPSAASLLYGPTLAAQAAAAAAVGSAGVFTQKMLEKAKIKKLF